MKTATRVQNRDMRLAIAQSVNKRDYVNEVLGTGAKPLMVSLHEILLKHLKEKIMRVLLNHL